MSNGGESAGRRGPGRFSIEDSSEADTPVLTHPGPSQVPEAAGNVRGSGVCTGISVPAPVYSLVSASIRVPSHRPEIDMRHLNVFPAAVLALLLIVVSACGEAPDPDALSETSPAPEIVDPTTVDYAPELDVDFGEMEETSTGLYYRDDVTGDGEVAEPGRTIVAHYAGHLADGTVFDDSWEREEPIYVELGVDPIIPGWEEGVQGMREGGRRTLVIPPHLAYGADGAAGVIPANAVLVFDLELLEVH